MIKRPLISVVVPVYNIRDYVARCLESLTRQSYENLEIVVVDDGSTDDSLEICKKFERDDKRVKVYHKKNGGLSDARNYGIKKARGEIVALVDGDDWVNGDYVAAMHEVMCKEDADIVVSGYNEERPKNAVMTGREAAAKLLVYQGNLDVVAWNKLYRKEIFTENEIWYPLGEKHEDALTTYKLFAAAKKVAYVKKSLYNYVEREGSIMQTVQKEERLKMRERAAREAMKYLRDDEELEQAAKIALLTAKYAYVDNAVSGVIPREYLAENMKWIGTHAIEYKGNKYMTKKLKLYNELCGSSAGRVLYKIFRKMRHE